MTYVKYKTKDYAEWQFLVWFTSGDFSFQLKAWQGARFPSLSVWEKIIGTCEKRSGNTVTSKERVLVTARSTDTFTITRSYGWDTALDFDADDYFCLHVNSDVIVDIQDEVTRLETDKADDSAVVHDTGNETIAWVKTFSSSPVVPTPASATDAANKSYVDSISGGGDNSFMAWESISAWNCMYLERWVTFAQATWVQNIGDVSANTRVAVKVVWSGVAASTLKLSLKKTGTPAGNLNVRIETDNSWSPSWSTVTDGTGSVTAASLSTSLADTTVTLAGNVTLTAWVTYWIVLYQGTYGAETISWTNYYNVWYSAVITERVGKLYNGSAWAVPATVTDNNGATWLTAGGVTARLWQVIYSKYNQILTKATKHANCTATMAYLYVWNDVVTTLVAIIAFSGNDANFNYPMTAGTYYTILCDNAGSTYTEAYGNASYPYNWTNVNVTVANGWNTTQTVNFTSFTTTNYLGWYAQSTAIESNLLFKTDADLAHKVPVALEPLKIASEAKSAWWFPAYTLPWSANKTVSWLTAWVEYFLSWTAGWLSSTPWTYKYRAGIAISPTILLQDSKSLLSAIQAAWSSPYTYQNITGVPVQLVISWWTVSVVAYSRDWTNYYTVATATNTQIVLQPYDYCKITYSSLPTLYINHY